MDLFSLLGIVILVLIVVFFGRILSVALKVLFYVLLVSLVLIFIFGVSYTELLNWATNVVLWVI
ncbi:MAG: hypothetical protein KJ597_03550 [Nanoarchaeota archaeon]|nr:hypothetical protein [Nanoarchaeota archaeon]MBU1622621.1 hypothetical protein [Nanoarchaeota archaeon]